MEELEEILGELVDDLENAKTTSEYHEPPSQRKTNTEQKATENGEWFKMSASYVQLGMPITQIHCLDEAINLVEELGTAPRCSFKSKKPGIISRLLQILQSISANQELARLLEELASSEPLNSITFKVDGVQVTLHRNHGRYSTSLRSTDPRLSQIQTIMSKIQSKYQLGVSNLQSELNATLQRLEEQKDILSSEQLDMERLRLQNEKFVIEASNKQRVLEVTKEVEAKLAARGFEIRKRLIGKKIVYQAVRRN